VPKGQVNETKNDVVANFLHIQPVKELKCDVEVILDNVVARCVTEHVPGKLIKRDNQVREVSVADEPGIKRKIQSVLMAPEKLICVVTLGEPEYVVVQKLVHKLTYGIHGYFKK
jgi:hypothetical protein